MRASLTGLLILITLYAVTGQALEIPNVTKDINVQVSGRLMKEKPGLLPDVMTQGEIYKGVIKCYVHLNFLADKL